MTNNITYSPPRAMKGHCLTLGHYLKDYVKDLSNLNLHRNRQAFYQKNPCNSHDEAYYRAPIEVHRSKRVSFSTQSFTQHSLAKKHDGESYGSHILDHNHWKNTGLFNMNEKETMQDLNQRLSTYLEKVSFLEQENSVLERKICEWYKDNAPQTLPDNSQYFRTIRELQNQVTSSTMENAQIIIHISNAQLAAEDLKNKYEIERNSMNIIKADIIGLHKALEELNMQRQGLEMEVQCLHEELLQLKNKHNEEVHYLQSQLGSRVNVTLNVVPSVDLNRTLSEIRVQYENLMEKNLREVENIFLNKSAELNHQMSSQADQITPSTNQIVDLKLSVQSLEIELQSQLRLKSVLESTLTEVENAYGSQLSQAQGLINKMETQISETRSELKRQNSNYQQLMDQKSLLEMEIETYKQLLDGPFIKTSSHHVTWNNNKGQPGEDYPEVE